MRTSLLLTFCSYLENTELSLAIQGNAWVIPSVQTIHILVIAATLIASLMINLRLLRLAGNKLSKQASWGDISPSFGLRFRYSSQQESS